jgi:beta-galactosidase
MIVRCIAAAVIVWAVSSVPLGAIETARIDTSTGAPRLVIDGKPVRARMFWGDVGSRPVVVRKASHEVVFEFSPLEDEPATATMHFRFNPWAGDIYLDNIHVVDIDSGRDTIANCDFESGPDSFSRSWTAWSASPRDKTGTVSVEPGKGQARSAGLHVQIAAPPDGRWTDFHIYHKGGFALLKTHRYRVSFWVKADPERFLTIAFYRPGRSYVFLGGPPDPVENQIRLAARAGVNLLSFHVPTPWPEPGQAADWSAVDDTCRKVLELNPKALLLPRFSMDPPAWWRKAHADDVMVWDRPGEGQVGAVVASPDYRRDAAERLTALVSHLEEKFGKHVFGYHPCGQNTEEWFYQNTWADPINGYAKGDQRAWRAWLKEHYRSDAPLRAAWRDPQASLATVVVPSPALRRAAPNGVLRDPASERMLIDFAHFQQEAMADCVCQLARAARQASRGRKLVVFFYGYQFEFGASGNGAATAGHYALRRVLNSPDIDVLCSPISYFDRDLGHGAPSMSVPESVALAGKMWLDEDDTATHLGVVFGPPPPDPVDTLEKTNQERLRNTAQCALRNLGTWWMDLTAIGWFNDPGIWAAMTQLKPLDETMLRTPRPFRPEIAAVIDGESMMRLAAGGQVVGLPGTNWVRRPLGRIGAPYGQYLLDDVAAGRVQAKVYIFLTAWCLSPRQRQRLLSATRDEQGGQSHLRADADHRFATVPSHCPKIGTVPGKVRVWCYAPGYQEDDQTSLDAMRELTGFRCKKLSGVKAVAYPTAAGRKAGLSQEFGWGAPIKPLFAAADATAEETLARYPDGSPGVALRRTGDGWSLFVGAPGLTSELLRLAARQAGAHLFTETDCNVYANGPYLVLHASQDGPLVINTGRPGPIRDMLSGQTVGHGPKATLPLRKGDTRILEIGR